MSQGEVIKEVRTSYSLCQPSPSQDGSESPVPRTVEIIKESHLRFVGNLGTVSLWGQVSSFRGLKFPPNYSGKKKNQSCPTHSGTATILTPSPVTFFCLHLNVLPGNSILCFVYLIRVFQISKPCLLFFLPLLALCHFILGTRFRKTACLSACCVTSQTASLCLSVGSL